MKMLPSSCSQLQCPPWLSAKGRPAKPSAETEKELIKIEHDMSNALIKGDTAAVEKMIAEDCFLRRRMDRRRIRGNAWPT